MKPRARRAYSAYMRAPLGLQLAGLWAGYLLTLPILHWTKILWIILPAALAASLAGLALATYVWNRKHPQTKESSRWS